MENQEKDLVWNLIKKSGLDAYRKGDLRKLRQLIDEKVDLIGIVTKDAEFCTIETVIDWADNSGSIYQTIYNWG